jgi:penicillin-binding protein 1C
MAALGGLAALALLLWTQPSLKLPDLAFSPEVIDRQGRVLRRFLAADGYWRLPVDLQRLDPRFIQDLLAIEDQRFFQHSGVDGLALLRATAQALIRGRVVSGASTLSMQTVRLLRPAPRTLLNKLREMLLALELERRLSKDAILRLYLSLAPYGGNIQGLTAASWLYFGKGPGRLTASERALLLALPQAPERRRPDRFPNRASQARDGILRRLSARGLLDEQERRMAQAEPVPHRRRPTPTHAAHLALRLVQDGQGRVGNTAASHRIPTYLDLELQRRLERQAGRVQAGLEPGATLALMLVDNASGQLLAHLGSGDYYQAGQWDMTQAWRSPGSSLKPFIYGLGFELGLMHPNSAFLDQPRRSGDYAPENFDKRYRGRVDLAQALRLSLNTAAVAALEKVGPQRWFDRIQAQGVELRLPEGSEPGLPMALGGLGIRLTDLVSLYAALANGGQYRSIGLGPELPVGRQTRLLSATAAWYLDEILRQMPAPAGYPALPGLRYKTGTSYGFRDAWAIGYNDHYTLGVWLGRPDNGYGKDISGQASAAPVLFALFEQLPKRPRRQRQQPAGVLSLAQTQLPAQMQWLGDVIHGTHADLGISLPADGARLPYRHDQHGQPRPLVIQAQGGVAPYQWLINGKPLPGQGEQGQLQWRPEGAGQVQISLVDAVGNTRRIGIWLEPEAARR